MMPARKIREPVKIRGKKTPEPKKPATWNPWETPLNIQGEIDARLTRFSSGIKGDSKKMKLINEMLRGKKTEINEVTLAKAGIFGENAKAILELVKRLKGENA